MLRDHDPITLREFKGTFDRGEDDVCPPGYFLDSRNVVFTEGGVETRKGTSLSVTLANVRRISVFDRIGEASRLILLDSSGNLWDSTSLVSPILSIPAMSDFSMVSLYNRAYITPHNGLRGLPGESIYVYEGSGVARAAAGSPPVGAAMTATDSPDPGSVEKGKHLFAVAFETVTGFITKPGPTVYTLYTAPGEKKVVIANIPTGPAGTVARHLLSTRVLPDTYAGDQGGQEYFFVPDGRIGDNFTTSFTLSFFDSDLQDSADWLMDELASIPAGAGIGIYGSRMVVWGPDDDESKVWVSKAGYPESFDATEGFFRAFPGDAGGGVRNCVEFRGNLYILKAQRTYATQETGDEPAFWIVTSIDAGVGTEVHGVAKILDLSGTALDAFVIADRSGLLMFNGTFAGNILTAAIDDIWSRINKSAFHTVEVVLDPIRKLGYVAVPLDNATLPSHILVADYQNGIENIRWTTWTFPKKPTTIVVDVDNTSKKSYLKFGSEEGNVHAYDETSTNDFGTAISSLIKFPFLPQSEGEINHFGGVRLRCWGVGSLALSISGLDNTQTQGISGVNLSLAPGRYLWRPFNFSAERAALQLNSVGFSNFRLAEVILFSKVLWLARAD
jgi:hypothetical protein